MWLFGGVAVDEPEFPDGLGQLFAGYSRQFRQKLRLYLLNSHEPLKACRVVVPFEIRLYGLFCPFDKHVHAFGLRVASGQFDDFGDQPTLFVSLYDQGVFMRHFHFPDVAFYFIKKTQDRLQMFAFGFDSPWGYQIAVTLR
jgi:hypothetical protein